VSELDWAGVVRVEKHDEQKQTTMVIADSIDTKHPFTRLSRYHVRFETIDDIGVLSISYRGTMHTAAVRNYRISGAGFGQAGAQIPYILQTPRV